METSLAILGEAFMRDELIVVVVFEVALTDLVVSSVVRRPRVNEELRVLVPVEGELWVVVVIVHTSKVWEIVTVAVIVALFPSQALLLIILVFWRQEEDGAHEEYAEAN